MDAKQTGEVMVGDKLAWAVYTDDGHPIEGTEATNELDAWRKAAHIMEAVYSDAIARSGLDLSLCTFCQVPVVWLPDGMPMCEDCAAAEAAGQ